MNDYTKNIILLGSITRLITELEDLRQKHKAFLSEEKLKVRALDFSTNLEEHIKLIDDCILGE